MSWEGNEWPLKGTMLVANGERWKSLPSSLYLSNVSKVYWAFPETHKFIFLDFTYFF